MRYELIDLLSSWGVIKYSGLLDLSDEAFQQRLKIQKASFLLRHLGISPFTDYQFSIYIDGPYSPELARDIYDFKPLKFSADRKTVHTLRWFVEHDSRWLEVASSIIFILERYPDMSERNLLSLLRLSKPWISSKLFRQIYSDLMSRGLIERIAISEEPDVKDL